MLFGTRVLKYWVLGPSACKLNYNGLCRLQLIATECFATKIKANSWSGLGSRNPAFNCVCCFGCRQNALSSEERGSRIEGGCLLHGLCLRRRFRGHLAPWTVLGNTCLDGSKLFQVGNERSHGMIPEAPGVHRGRHEARAKRVSLQQRRQLRSVPEVVGIGSSRKRRAGRRLHGDEADLGLRCF